MVHDTIFNPDRVEPNGQWGTALYKNVTTPDGKNLELAVYIGEAPMPRGEDETRPTFKIITAFPVQGDGVTEALPDGSLVPKEFPSDNPVGDGNG